MSPAKQNSSDKHAGQGKKASSRQFSASGGVSASAYNPVCGTFHPLESVASDPGTSNHNGRLRSADGVDDHTGPNGAGVEYDSMSNNGSCSGESEDHLHVNEREKQGCRRLGTSPRLVGGVDKIEKIRGKNERKHQRQKERRAQELRDRCTGYLMSRKLEALAQQLVAMGFNHERATLALILNEGNVERSVAWILECGEGEMKEVCNADYILKIDISEELARITEIENNYKYTKPEIERAIVSCEGDLDKALQWLQTRCRSISPARVQERITSASRRHGGEHGHAKEQPPLAVPVSSTTSGAVQTKNSGLLEAALQPKSVDENLSSTKGRLQSSPNKIPHTIEGGVKGLHSSGSSSRVSTNWLKLSLLADDIGTNYGAKLPSTSAQTSSHTNVTSAHFAADSRSDSGPANHTRTVEGKSPHLTSRDYSISTHSSQSMSISPGTSMCTDVCSASTSTLIFSSGWNSNAIGAWLPPSALGVNAASENSSLKVGTAGKQENVSKPGADLQRYNPPLFSTQLDSVAASLTSGRSGVVITDTSVASPNLLSPSAHSRGSLLTSFGLYNGWGSGIHGSSVDWSMGSMANCDYKNIDWSVATSPSSSLEVGRVWGLSSSLMPLKLSGLKFDPCMGGKVCFEDTSRSAVRAHEYHNVYDVWIGPNQTGSTSTSLLGLQDQSRAEFGSTTVFGEQVWTSPFAGKNLFSLPQQAVPSPLL